MKKTAKDERITLSILSVLAMILLLAASLTAILLDDGGAPYPFTTPRGEQVKIYGGAGPYQFDNTYLPSKLASNFPRKSVVAYVLAVGLILLAQYLAEVIAAHTTGIPPASLDHYTTLELASLELGIMIPLHIIGGLALWRRQTLGYLATTVLAFTAFMVFIALSISLLLFYLSYGRGDLLDTATTLGIALVAAGFSFAILERAKD